MNNTSYNTSPTWGVRSLCLSEGDPSWWDDYLDLDDDGALQETPADRLDRHDKAKAICARCPVRMECQIHTDIYTDEGIRFGELVAELRRMRTNRKRLAYEVLRRSA